ncbi:spore germination protein GerW family protein [Streptomyces sp. NPDC005805]|uniref:GerW family sporulation protein n=1 Tax=Streptomyces sp. NPDC005805 TaxID=3157068 RepID=UPI0033FA6A6E
MTSEDDADRPAPPAAADAARTAADLLEALADRFGARACARTVFGEPVTHGDVTVVPVAGTAYGFGAGLGAGRETETARTGGGGGGGAGARPRGFIVIAGGTAVYKSVSNPWTEAAAPLAAFLAGLAVCHLAHRRAARG